MEKNKYMNILNNQPQKKIEGGGQIIRGGIPEQNRRPVSGINRNITPDRINPHRQITPDKLKDRKITPDKYRPPVLGGGYQPSQGYKPSYGLVNKPDRPKTPDMVRNQILMKKKY